MATTIMGEENPHVCCIFLLSVFDSLEWDVAQLYSAHSNTIIGATGLY